MRECTLYLSRVLYDGRCPCTFDPVLFDGVPNNYAAVKVDIDGTVSVGGDECVLIGWEVFSPARLLDALRQGRFPYCVVESDAAARLGLGDAA